MRPASAVICEHIDETTAATLHPQAPFDRVQNRSWIGFASSLLANIASLYSLNNQLAFDAMVATLRARFLTLEATLGDGPFFNRHDFSIVDAAFTPVFRYFNVIEPYAEFDFSRTHRNSALGARHLNSASRCAAP